VCMRRIACIRSPSKYRMASDRDRSSDGIFSVPRHVDRLEDCYFYHSIELPQHGLINGEWDLRSGVKKYLGHVHFHGKRVLDIGTASGFLAFWMELQGAEVIAFDLSDKYSRDLVPFGGLSDGQESDSWEEHLKKLNNSFWLTRGLLGSKVRMVYGTVYDIPEAIGQVDIITFGSVLLHLRDPFLALQSALRLAKETVIVVEGFPTFHAVPLALLSMIKPISVFLPNAKKASPRDTWWALPPRTVVEYLKILGFQKTHINYHVQRYHGKHALMYTVVGRRTPSTNQ
jgi:SAM-dependent methyltransferase